MTEIDPEKPSEAIKAKAVKKPSAQKRPEPKGERKGVGAPFVVLCSAVAAMIGGAAGFYGPKLLDPANAAPAQAITQNIEQIKTMQMALDDQSKTLTAIKKQNAQISEMAQQGASLAPRLEQAETALSTLEAVQSENTQREAERLDLIESLVSSSDDPQAGAVALAQSLEEMQAQIAALKLSAATAEPAVISYESAPSNPVQDSDTSREGEDVSEAQPDDVEGEAALEGVDSEKAAPQEAAAKPVETYDFVANFPKEKMLAALLAQEQNTPKPSWLRRTLQKHVQSESAPQVNARRVIDEAQALTAQGDILSAADKLQTLNPTLRAAAHMWLTEARKLR